MLSPGDVAVNVDFAILCSPDLSAYSMQASIVSVVGNKMNEMWQNFSRFTPGFSGKVKYRDFVLQVGYDLHFRLVFGRQLCFARLVVFGSCLLCGSVPLLC